MSASRTTQKELLGLLARIAAACETADSIVPTGLESLYDEIIETLEEAEDDSYQIVLNQLDELEGMNRYISGPADRKKLIAQIKKDVVKIQS